MSEDGNNILSSVSAIHLYTYTDTRLFLFWNKKKFTVQFKPETRYLTTENKFS